MQVERMGAAGCESEEKVGKKGTDGGAETVDGGVEMMNNYP